MNSAERDGGGGGGKAGGEIDKNGKTETEQNVKEIKDQNGKEEISVKVQGETSGLGEEVKGDQVKVEEDKVKEDMDKVKVEDGVETLSRLSESGKPWISTIYNTGSLCSPFLKWNLQSVQRKWRRQIVSLSFFLALWQVVSSATFAKEHFFLQSGLEALEIHIPN